MGKKKCSVSSSSTNCCDSSSSSSCCNTSSSNCYSSSSSFTSCCRKYPKCNCAYKNKCSPVYYPNNCVGNYPCPPSNNYPCPPSNNYPCNPCPPTPCPPYPCPPYPCPPYPCPPATYCGTPYTSSGSVNTSTAVTLSASSPNVNIFSSSDTTVTLPAISSLSCCKYTKMLVISNISSTTLTLSASVSTNGQDGFASSLISSTYSVPSDTTVTLYAVYIPGGQNLWVIA